MTDQTITPNIRRDRGSDAATHIDFAISTEGISLVVFVPLTLAAREHSLEAFSAAMEWGRSYIVETEHAGAIVADLFAQGFRLSLDGREIVPARRPC